MLGIIERLNGHDLSRLNLVNKRFHAVSQPLLWDDIEFHTAGYHECPAELKDPAPFRPPSQRFSQHRYGGDAKYNAEALFTMLEEVEAEDPERLRNIVARVKHLCTVIETPTIADTIIRLLPHFKNLETLELHGEWFCCDSKAAAPDVALPPLPALRFVKLFGYMPRVLVRVALQCGVSMERLELSALDRPVSPRFFDEEQQRHPPQPEDKIGVDSDGESDYGSLRQPGVIPRPLGGFLPSDPAEPALPALRHLHLCQTAGWGWFWCMRDAEYGCSMHAVRRCLADWRRILLASSRTLETLVVEQREAGDISGVHQMEFEYYMGSRREEGPETVALMDTLTSLFEDPTAFPALRRIFLRGVAVDETSEGSKRPSAETPGGQFMLLAERRGISCEAKLGELCLFDDESGEVFCSEWSASQYNPNSDSDDDDCECVGRDAEKSNEVLARV